MPLWRCDFEQCRSPGVRTLGDCVLCNRHLCSKHLQAEFHRCPLWEDELNYDPAARKAGESELEQLIEKISTTALAARATRLRGGIACSIPPLKYERETCSSVMGGMNYHIEVRLRDGKTWLARIRRFNATSPPKAVRDYIIISEVATLEFLEKTNVPAPRVFDYALEDQAIGVGFILMEKMPGKSLRWSIATQAQRNRVMSQLCEVYIELHKYPFDSLGCLESPGSSQVGAFARELLMNVVEPKVCKSGPFLSIQEYHKSSLQQLIGMIMHDEMYSQRAVDAYLIHRFLIDLIPLVVPPQSGSEPEDAKFYLKHTDDKGDHILVDEEFNITGAIDWEWACTAPPFHAFNSPIGLLPVAEFYDGKNTLGKDESTFAAMLEEKGHPELAGYVRRGRLQHRFAFCCGFDLTDWDGFLGLFKGLRAAVSVDADLEWDEWKAVALERYKDEEDLQVLLSRPVY